MKTVFITLILVVFVTMVNAQDLVSSNVPSFQDSQNLVLSPAKEARIAKKQNKAVTVQLQHYISSHAKYSEAMKENCLEGEALIQIEFFEDGTVSNIKIVKSPSSEITKSLLEMMTEFTKVDLEEAVYYGHQKVRIPVAFSIR